MNHTPSPWVAKARATGGYNIVAVDDVLEDTVVGTAVLNDHSLETAHANACVLAAAPKMLELLMRLSTYADIAGGLGGEDIDDHEVTAEVRAFLEGTLS